MNQQVILDQIDVALRRFAEAKRRSKYDDLSDLPNDLKNEIITVLSTTIDRLAPRDSPYRANAQTALKTYGVDNSYNIQILGGILTGLRSDYSAGFLHRVEELVQADLFSDFLEMAEYLLDEGFKDPAAVLAGGVLEEHLRKLCERAGISTTVGGRPKKADALNSDLAAASAYGKLDHKSVTAWLDLRNNAAHGKYDEYSKEQVALMLQGVRDFLVRHSL